MQEKKRQCIYRPRGNTGRNPQEKATRDLGAIYAVSQIARKAAYTVFCAGAVSRTVLCKRLEHKGKTHGTCSQCEKICGLKSKDQLPVLCIVFGFVGLK